MDYLLSIIILWFCGAALTVPLLAALEGILVLLRGAEYRKEWMGIINSWGSLSGPGWRILFLWPLFWVWWGRDALQGRGVVDSLHLKHVEEGERRDLQERLLSRTMHKMKDLFGAWSWMCRIDQGSNTSFYCMVVTCGPLLLTSHVVTDDHKGNYTIVRSGDPFGMDKLQGVPASCEPLSFEEAVLWCEEDTEWVSLCSQLDADEERLLFLFPPDSD